MKIFKDNDINIENNTAIALGSFDGLHIGHKALIEKTINVAKANNINSMVFTFANHPLSIVDPDRTPKLLTSGKIKEDYMGRMGIDYLMLAPFSKEFMNISPECFIQMLMDHYNCSHIIVGYNYRFGYKNLGDTDLLRKLESRLGFKLHIIKPVSKDNIKISSTFIRGLILEGEIVNANKFLGHPFVLDGSVIHGKMIGRTIGFPTLNLDYDLKCIVPKGGVYFTIIEIKNKFYKGITNVGYNPTVNGQKLSIESHVLDFSKDIYGEHIKVHFIRRIRDEKKFDTLNDLREQLEKDKESVKSELIWF